MDGGTGAEHRGTAANAAGCKRIYFSCCSRRKGGGRPRGGGASGVAGVVAGRRTAAGPSPTQDAQVQLGHVTLWSAEPELQRR